MVGRDQHGRAAVGILERKGLHPQVVHLALGRAPGAVAREPHLFFGGDVDDGGAGFLSRIEAVLEPGTYFWRVSSIDAQGYESAWSNTSHFIYPMKLR